MTTPRQPAEVVTDYAALFPMMGEAELEALVKDIKTNGLLSPIVMWNDRILDGRNRFLACTKAGVQPRFIRYEGDSPLAFVIGANLHRRHLNDGQRAMLAADLLPRLEAEAKQRQRMGKAKLPDPNRAGQARDHAARLLKTSARYVQDAKRLGKTHPNLAKAVRTGVLSMAEAKVLCALPKAPCTKILGKKQRDPKTNIRREVAALAHTSGETHTVLYVNPPWTNGLETLRALPVKAEAADDAVLFLLTPLHRLADALYLMGNWGFKYATNFVVLRKRPIAESPDVFVRAQHDLLLVGKRGKAPVPVTTPGSVLASLGQVRRAIAAMYPGVKCKPSVGRSCAK